MILSYRLNPFNRWLRICGVNKRIIGYHHVNQNIGRDHIDAVRHFYRDVLGLDEISARQQDPGGERLIWFSLGAGQLHRAKRMVRKSLLWGLAVSFVIAISAAATAPWTLRLFTQDPQIIAGTFMAIVAGLVYKRDHAHDRHRVLLHHKQLTDDQIQQENRASLSKIDF